MSVSLLFDENLSPRLAETLGDLYAGSRHVHAVGLGSGSDFKIWDFARENDMIVVSKDRDFLEFSVDLGPHPKVIWVGIGNCTTKRVEDLLRREAIRIAHFAEDRTNSVLVLR